MMQLSAKMIVATVLMFSFIRCSSDEKKSDTAEGTFAIAEEFEKAERYELALQKYTDVKNKYPYSPLAIKSELAIADVHFKQEAWPEAQMSYQTFHDLHPTHPQTDYVIFRIGLSYYNQLPETVDRDLTLADDAIARFNEILQKYPKSEYAKESQEKKQDSLKKLAGKEMYIGDFYFSRKVFDSALPRFEGLLQKYSDLGFDASALAKASICAAKTDQKNKAQKYLSLLKKKYPDSSEYETALKEIKE